MSIKSSITFVFINCNRLKYLHSCVETLFETTDIDRDNVIVVDNASIETGTAEYLDSLQRRGCRVISRGFREPKAELAKALNQAFECVTSRHVCMLPADIQFVARGNWLDELSNILDTDSSVGSIVLDAQRAVTHAAHVLSRCGDHYADASRYIVTPWGALCRTEDQRLAYPWDAEIDAAGLSSLEDNTVKKIHASLQGPKKNMHSLVLKVPVSITIWNDKGQQAKVRGNSIYGKYVDPVDGVHYYKVYDYEDAKTKFASLDAPVSIEMIAETVGWKAPLDSSGSWIKSGTVMNYSGDACSEDVEVHDLSPAKETILPESDPREAEEKLKDHLNDSLDEWLNS
jgi:glycosyltransferase involved in cell wall biosynthesis